MGGSLLLSLWLILLLIYPDSGIRPYYVSWQAIVDQETAEKLIAGMQEIKLVQGAEVDNESTRSTPEFYRESLGEDLPEELKQPQEVSLSGYRGSGDFVRRIIAEDRQKLASKAISSRVHWIYDHLLGLRRQTPVKLSLSYVLNQVKNLFKPGPESPQRKLSSGLHYRDDESEGELSLSHSMNGFFREKSGYSASRRLSACGEISMSFRDRGGNESHPGEQSFSFRTDFDWKEDLYEGDAIVLLTRNPRFNAVGYAVISVVERVDMPEEYGVFIPVRDAAQDWLNYGPEKIRKLLDRCRQWNVNGEKSLRADPAWTKRLSDGRQVSLMLVGRPQEYPGCWWSPNGRGVNSSCFGMLTKFSSLHPAECVLRIIPANEKTLPEKRIDLRDDPKIAYMMETINSTTRMIRFPAGGRKPDWDQVESFARISFIRRESNPQGAIEILFSTGDWQKLGEVVKGKPSRFGDREVHVMDIGIGWKYGLSNSHVGVSCRVKNFISEEFMLTALAKDGKRFESGLKRISPVIKHPEYDLGLHGFKESFDGISENDIDHFDLYVRPLETVRFENINFSPEGLPEAVVNDRNPSR